VVLAEPKSGIDHLSIPDVKVILNKIRPKVAIITHYGMGVWKAKPPILARMLSDETGVLVIAARDGMRFDIDRLEVVK
jgi:hypothetical protein